MKTLGFGRAGTKALSTLPPHSTWQALPTPSPPAPATTTAHDMAQENRPPLPSLSPSPQPSDPTREGRETYTLTDPFVDRPRQINFTEPAFPTPNQSVTSFPNEFGTLNEYEDESEKLLAPGSHYPYVYGRLGLYIPVSISRWQSFRSQLIW